MLRAFLCKAAVLNNIHKMYVSYVLVALQSSLSQFKKHTTQFKETKTQKQQFLGWIGGKALN